jgi:cytoskeletal protein CcmA (bactofilin family)
MNKLIYSLLVFLIIAAFLPSTVSAKTLNDDKVVWGGTFKLGDSDTLKGNLIVIGGTATLAEDSTVTGDIVLIGGTLTVGGNVNGSMIVVGGSANLKNSAYVFGDLITASSSVEQDAGATIAGTVQQNFTIPFQVPFSGDNQTSPETKPGITVPDLNPLLKTSRIGFRSFGVAILAMLLALVVPNMVKRVIHPILTAPIISGGFGLLTIFVAPIVLVMIAITLIGIPISLLGILVLGFASFLGWAAIGAEIGNRIARSFKSQWHIAVSAGVGTLLLTLVTQIIGLIYCIGWITPFLFSMLGLGAVVLTRLGTREYVKNIS